MVCLFRTRIHPRASSAFDAEKTNMTSHASPTSNTVLPCPLIEVSGSPRERGRQYGEQAAVHIRRGIGHYTRQLESNKLGWKELQHIVATFEPTIAEFDPN
jgi:isopenicillin-N N-acyltransferase-like protein